MRAGERRLGAPRDTVRGRMMLGSIIQCNGYGCGRRGIRRSGTVALYGTSPQRSLKLGIRTTSHVERSHPQRRTAGPKTQYLQALGAVRRTCPASAHDVVDSLQIFGRGPRR